MLKLLLVVLSFLILSGCTINIETEKEPDSNLEPNEEIDEIEAEEEEIFSIGLESSVASPLKVGQYGIASKYNAILEEYKDVDVGITKIYDNPDEIISDYNLDNPDNIIEKKDGYKYVVLDYEVIFYDFETESFGTDVILDMEVLNSDNNNFVTDGVKQVIGINVLEKSTGVVNGERGTVQVAFAIPNDVTNYLVKFGTSEHTIAYYKV